MIFLSRLSLQSIWLIIIKIPRSSFFFFNSKKQQISKRGIRIIEPPGEETETFIHTESVASKYLGSLEIYLTRLETSATDGKQDAWLNPPQDFCIFSAFTFTRDV